MWEILVNAMSEPTTYGGFAGGLLVTRVVKWVRALADFLIVFSSIWGGLVAVSKFFAWVYSRTVNRRVDIDLTKGKKVD